LSLLITQIKMTQQNPPPQDSKSLWLGDIENWMDETYVTSMFAQIAPVTGVKIIRDKNSGMPMGYGFVEFTTNEIAAKVLQMYNGQPNPATNK